MSTQRTFQNMLNEYLTYDLLKEELMKKDYLLSNIEKDDGWKGGNLVVPFKGAGASSVSFGSLTASNDIAEDQYVRGGVSTYKEVWGSLLFNHRDFIEHDGKVNEKSFLKILPQTIDDFTDFMKNAISVNLLNGAHFMKATATGTALGVLAVDRPDRAAIGQKVEVKSSTQPTVIGYVSVIGISQIGSRSITLVTTRGGAIPVDLSLYTVADGTKVYHPGAQTAAFSSLRSALLSAANGGDAALYGQTKTAYPYLQSINVVGSTVDATNLLAKIFDAYTDMRTYGKGNPNEVLMSYKNLGTVMKLIELSKGAYKTTPNTQKASIYGWTEIEVVGVKGALKVVGIQEIDDDVIMFIDWRALKFHSNGFFRKRINPDGREYYEVRATSGFQYIVDMFLFGELVLNRPSYCGIMYGISY